MTPAGQGLQDSLHGGAAVLLRVVVSEGSKRLQQIGDAGLQAVDPRLKRRQGTGTPLHDSAFEHGIEPDL